MLTLKSVPFCSKSDSKLMWIPSSKESQQGTKSKPLGPPPPMNAETTIHAIWSNDRLTTKSSAGVRPMLCQPLR